MAWYNLQSVDLNSEAGPTAKVQYFSTGTEMAKQLLAKDIRTTTTHELSPVKKQNLESSLRRNSNDTSRNVSFDPHASGSRSANGAALRRVRPPSLRAETLVMS